MNASYLKALSLCAVFFVGLSFYPNVAISADEISVDYLLQQVKKGHRKDQLSNEQRLQEFKDNKDQQQILLAEVIQQRKKAEQLSQRREQNFEDNEQKIMLLQERLTDRLGSLKELFGVLQLVSNDMQGQFENSLIQMHYPNRTEQLTTFSKKMGQTTELPSIEEIEALWFELQREMTESGKITTSQQTVLTASGQELEMDVIRVGTFNLVADGKYLQRIPETGRIVEFPRQPSQRYMNGATDILDSENNLFAFTIDPIRGQLISILGAAPNIIERAQQGGVIGYIIIGLGVFVVLFAIGRFFLLVIQDSKIQRQLKQLDKPEDNALGHILKVYHESKTEEIESLELKLSEVILREIPKINWGLSFLKITAAIAPLLGLLGTVTGMIITFQAITLFGAGDPKLMAGGISQALVTTVLGLSVAIPTLLLHNLVQSKANKITEIIEQESIALVAMQSEQTIRKTSC